MNLHYYLKLTAALYLLVCFCDLRWRKIPNNLLLALLLVQLIGVYFSNFFIGSSILILALGMLAYSVGICGAGDVKFCALAALSLPISSLSVALILTALMGGGLAVMFMLLGWLTRRRPNPVNYRQLPYGVAISLGFYITTYDHLMPVLAS
ncbi:A24 family peptidase [Vibrio chaetopteri]|uniref:A24 family peptidase n=1 Tax=Vibrio chaetopteri TaxID=3016528 RepID=UPI003AB2EC56